MRVSDYRYSRDRQRLDVAMRFIRHEARTHTIRQWTGLTDDRIRKLYHSYLQAGGRAARHRGKSPRQAAVFLRTTRMRDEASALASLCCLAGLFDRHRREPCPPESSGVNRAVSLIQAYEGYEAAVHNPAISFEHAILLVNTLARGGEVRLGNCQDCGALLVVDVLALRPTRCSVCASQVAASTQAALPFASVRCHAADPKAR